MTGGAERGGESRTGRGERGWPIEWPAGSRGGGPRDWPGALLGANGDRITGRVRFLKTPPLCLLPTPYRCRRHTDTNPACTTARILSLRPKCDIPALPRCVRTEGLLGERGRSISCDKAQTD